METGNCLDGSVCCFMVRGCGWSGLGTASSRSIRPDYAGVLTPAVIATMEQQHRALFAQTEVAVVIVTIDTLCLLYTSDAADE